MNYRAALLNVESTNHSDADTKIAESKVNGAQTKRDTTFSHLTSSLVDDSEQDLFDEMMDELRELRLWEETLVDLSKKENNLDDAIEIAKKTHAALPRDLSKRSMEFAETERSLCQKENLYEYSIDDTTDTLVELLHFREFLDTEDHDIGNLGDVLSVNHWDSCY